ncbi:hypothetical protein TIFTF001_041958 [Ficus carica]|uniref:Uncharacterized protein n=1 Tax=Ficus carica TaxID=3494 RepID=A0AA88CX21_FICCA|nr:hypothetical protein TIFTF001_041951 [Ficus carica]GMN33795.1 hypothetical protein TIFTF001_041953 [Ficus carica]GMN33806.1 hypothetical protein TIFTF001_041956 [Ficus carica]GMN33828.1 hypothetical protein TIFTF001_041958 [Ficus carica]
MMKMFRSDLVVVISSGPYPPTTVAECVSRAIRAEYWVGRNKEQRAKFFKVKKEEKLKLEGPAISQGRLESPEPHGRIYAYTKEDVQAGPSTVVTGQLPFAQQDAYVLIHLSLLRNEVEEVIELEEHLELHYLPGKYCCMIIGYVTFQ